VATIDTNGVAHAIGLGTTTIRATQLGLTGSTTLTVTTGCIQRIDVTPVDPGVRVGNDQPFTAMATTCNGSIDITDVATWNSTNVAVATIDSSGVAHTLTTGSTDITASSGGVTSPAQTLSVTP